LSTFELRTNLVELTTPRRKRKFEKDTTSNSNFPHLRVEQLSEESIKHFHCTVEVHCTATCCVSSTALTASFSGSPRRPWVRRCITCSLCHRLHLQPTHAPSSCQREGWLGQGPSRSCAPGCHEGGAEAVPRHATPWHLSSLFQPAYGCERSDRPSLEGHLGRTRAAFSQNRQLQRG
jgi:hypothetical protein